MNRLLIIAVLIFGFNAGQDMLLAQVPNPQQQFNEAIRTAQRTELISYILVGAGILLVAASIPLGIYLDRKKKARKQAEQGPDVGPPNA